MWIFEYLVEWPAKQGGYILGNLLHGIYVIAVFWSVIYAGVFVYHRIQIAVVNALAATLVGLWLLGVLVEGERFIALGMLEGISYTFDSDE